MKKNQFACLLGLLMLLVQSALGNDDVLQKVKSVQHIAAAARSGDEAEQFTLSGGPSSPLFSQCIEDARTVHGSLYSISVSEDEDYVRFVPKETMEVAWTDVDQSQASDILQCAFEAFELGAYMFQYDGSCRVAMTNAYDPDSEQGCDDAATEVVYLTTRVAGMNIMDGVVVPVGESYGCLVSTENGFSFGDDENRLVDEAMLPPKDTCCPQSFDGHCVVADCADNMVSYCEGKTRCEARGYLLANGSLFRSLTKIPDLTELGTDLPTLWINAMFGEDGVWRWLPGMDVVGEFVPGGRLSNYFCAFLYYTGDQIEFTSASCTSNMMKCSICYDPNTSLPSCA